MTNSDAEQTIPLIGETVTVGKADVITDWVRVSTVVEERPVLIDEMIARGELHMERIAVDKPVPFAPAPRMDGETLVVSIVEERLVIAKRLFVIEELHITRTSTTERVTIPETIRTMRAVVERAGTGRDIDG